MPIPFYQVPFLGNGMTIGLDAVLHVIISHGFAIGMMSMIVLAEFIGWRRSDPRWEKLAHDLFGFALIVIMGVGAILGAGIWLVTTALEPRGIASLLRVFFWPWFIEWFAFTGEVIVILIYYFTWKRWTYDYAAGSCPTPRERALKLRHVRVGFGYMLFALASAFLITGILGFMLTPDGWPRGRSFISGFFNETFLPQLLLRLSGAYTLGAVFSMAYVVFKRREAEFQRIVLGIVGRIALAGALTSVVWTVWYFEVVPSRFKAQAVFAVLTSYVSQHPWIFWIANAIGLALLLWLAAAALKRREVMAKALVIPVVICCVGFVTEFERIREFIRGPYIMPGYMYANQVLLSESPLYQQQGMLASAYWYNAAAETRDVQSAGAYLFSQNCAACHTIGGINNIATRVAGRSEDGIYVIIGHTHEMVPFMSPFSGTAQEQRILAQYLFQVAKDPAAAGHPSRFIAVQ